MKFTFNTIDPITGQNLDNISGDEKNFVRTEIRKHLAAQGKETQKLKKGESRQFEVEILAGENLGEACERVAKTIGANWWSNEAKYGNETFFEYR